MSIYTRTGDDGTTGLPGNQRVRKDHARIEACGDIDELNAVLGVIGAHLPPEAAAAQSWIDEIQSDLFHLGAQVAAGSAASRATLASTRATALEQSIDHMEKSLRPLKNFILPQGIPATAFAHMARAVGRRAERRIVALAAEESIPAEILIYLNRLSDWLFVLARWINAQADGLETPWLPSEGDLAPPTVDRLSATLGKLEDEKRKRQTLFEKTSLDMQKKRDAAQKLFQQGVKKVQDEGGKVEKPLRDMDLD